MDNGFIANLPIPACVVNTDGSISLANPVMKNVFPYEDIVGYKFFALTGVRREQLLSANEEELIVDKNGKKFKLWVNENASEDEELVVFFDEATARESFRARLEDERAVIVYINIDNYDELIASAPEDYRRVIPSQIDGIVRKWGDSFQSPVISTGDERYVMYTNQSKLSEMIESNFTVLDEVRDIESQLDFPASISIGAGVSAMSLIESSELAEAALELALGRGGDQVVVKRNQS